MKETYPEGTDFPAVVDLSTAILTEEVPILFNHDPDRRIGRTLSLRVEDGMIVGIGELELDKDQAKDIAQSGAHFGVSIGSGLINPADKTLVRPGETIEVNGRQLAGPFVLLSHIEVREVSITPVAADSQTSVLLASMTPIKGEPKMTFEDFAAAKGFDLTTLDEVNRVALETAFAELVQATIEEEETEPEAVAATGEEEVKPEAVAEEEEVKPEAVAATGEEETTEAVQASIRKLFPSLNAPRRAPLSTPVKKSAVLQASALMQTGVPAQWLEKQGFSRAELDAADKTRGVDSILGLMGETLRASGRRVDYRQPTTVVDNYRELLRASAVSTQQFGDVNILSPIIDKQLRYRFEEMTPIWSKLFTKRVVRDFNEVATVDFDVTGSAKTLVENEDFPQVALQSSGQKFSVAKQGIQIGLSFESQINDDLGVLTRIADQIIYVITDSQTQEFWTMFWSLINNSYTGTNRVNAALSVDGLSAAKKAFQSKKNAGGRFLHVPPKFLLVPPALEDVALNLFEWKWGTDMAGNIHVGKYEVLSDVYMGPEGGFRTATDTNWLMLADPERYPLGEYAVLSGYETPVIKETWYDHKDALQLRALGTVGFCGYTDKVPAVFSTGTGN